jgi:four helix bundle protein
MKHNVHELKIWKRSIDLVVDVYKLTAEFPKEERYGLISQARRAAVSMPSNIAEGAGRITDKDFCHFLGISNGSSYELMTHLIVARRLGLITEEQVKPVLAELDEVQKMIYAFQAKLSTAA